MSGQIRDAVALLSQSRAIDTAKDGSDARRTRFREAFGVYIPWGPRAVRPTEQARRAEGTGKQAASGSSRILSNPLNYHLGRKGYFG